MYTKEDSKELRLEFWQGLKNRTRRLPGQKGRVKKWMFDHTGVKGLDLRFDVDREKAQVALEINIGNPEDRFNLYSKLEAARTIFESTFGAPLTWARDYEKATGQQVCRVYVQLPADIHDKEKWPKVFYFLIDSMMRLEKAYIEVKDYLMADINN